MKKILFVLTLGLALVLTSCGDQHKAQSLVKDFLNETWKTKIVALNASANSLLQP